MRLRPRWVISTNGGWLLLFLLCRSTPGIAFQNGMMPLHLDKSCPDDMHPFMKISSLSGRASMMSTTRLYFWKDDRDPSIVEEEARLKILAIRRRQIRGVLKTAESIRNFRLERNLVPQLDEQGKPMKSDSKVAVTITAFMVAAGAIALRIGGRAALISAVGLDFITDNPDLKDNLDKVLIVADSTNDITKILLFTVAWTGVKVLCFDAGGVVLALASGILFGGVLQGAVLSAAAATFGSTIAFGLARLKTPVRNKALQILEEYPSLRGIEKVVAKDGIKAILTLRLAPVLPIPIGMYNYVYGVTNVKIIDFAAGIFLGSLKPYLLDSYLGYFGKSLIDGNTDPTGIQDLILLAALGFSVLIGVFASQLAGETWDSVLEEVEAEKMSREGSNEGDKEEEHKDSSVRELFGFNVPKWMVDLQLALKSASVRVNDLIQDEVEAQFWNYTIEEGGPPADRDPSKAGTSREVLEAYQKIDFGESFCEDLVLTPNLIPCFFKYADPLYREDQENDATLEERRKRRISAEIESTREELLGRLRVIREEVLQKVDVIDAKLRRNDN